MKKTLFLAALAVAIATPQVNAANTYIANGGDVDVTVDAGGRTLIDHDASGDYTYSGNITLGADSWMGPGLTDASNAAQNANAIWVTLSGNLTGGSNSSFRFNNYATNENANVVWDLTGTGSSIQGEMRIDHGAGATAYSQVNLNSAFTGEAAPRVWMGNKNKEILNIATKSVTLGALEGGNATSAITASVATTMTLSSAENKTFNGSIGMGQYFTKETYNTSAAPTTDSAAISLIKEGTGTQYILGGVKLAALTVKAGQVSLTEQSGASHAADATTIGSVTVESGTTFSVGYNEGTIESLTLEGGKLFVYDMHLADMADHHLTINTLKVTQNSTLENQWKGVMDITKVTGDANLALSKTASGTNDKMTLNIGSITDFNGNITKPGSNDSVFTVTLGSVNQAAGKAATLTKDVTLNDGFAKTGAGSVAFAGAALSGAASIEQGTVTANSVSLKAEKALSIKDAANTSLTHDKVTYTALSGKTGTITRSEDGGLALFNNGSTTTLKDITLTAGEGKAYSVVMDNVSLNSSNNANIWLKGAEKKDLLDVTTGGNLYIGAGDYGNGDTIAASISGTATVNSITTGANATLKVSGTVTAAADSTITSLELLGGTVTVKEDHTGTLNVGTLKVMAAGSTVNANLNLMNTTTLTLNNALTMGCNVELGDGGINLTGTVLDTLATEGSVTLFDDVESVTINGAAYSHILYASEVFSNSELQNTADAKYLVSYDGSAVTLSVVPEPATATLSLLALVGLAARRRRR